MKNWGKKHGKRNDWAETKTLQHLPLSSGMNNSLNPTKCLFSAHFCCLFRVCLFTVLSSPSTSVQPVCMQPACMALLRATVSIVLPQCAVVLCRWEPSCATRLCPGPGLFLLSAAIWKPEQHRDKPLLMLFPDLLRHPAGIQCTNNYYPNYPGQLRLHVFVLIGWSGGRGSWRQIRTKGAAKRTASCCLMHSTWAGLSGVHWRPLTADDDSMSLTSTRAVTCVCCFMDKNWTGLKSAKVQVKLKYSNYGNTNVNL